MLPTVMLYKQKKLLLMETLSVVRVEMLSVVLCTQIVDNVIC